MLIAIIILSFLSSTRAECMDQPVCLQTSEDTGTMHVPLLHALQASLFKNTFNDIHKNTYSKDIKFDLRCSKNTAGHVSMCFQTIAKNTTNSKQLRKDLLDNCAELSGEQLIDLYNTVDYIQLTPPELIKAIHKSLYNKKPALATLHNLTVNVQSTLASYFMTKDGLHMGLLKKYIDTRLEQSKAFDTGIKYPYDDYLIYTDNTNNITVTTSTSRLGTYVTSSNYPDGHHESWATDLYGGAPPHSWLVSNNSDHYVTICDKLLISINLTNGTMRKHSIDWQHYCFSDDRNTLIVTTNDNDLGYFDLTTDSFQALPGWQKDNDRTITHIACNEKGTLVVVTVNTTQDTVSLHVGKKSNNSFDFTVQPICIDSKILGYSPSTKNIFGSEYPVDFNCIINDTGNLICFQSCVCYMLYDISQGKIVYAQNDALNRKVNNFEHPTFFKSLLIIPQTHWIHLPKLIKKCNYTILDTHTYNCCTTNRQIEGRTIEKNGEYIIETTTTRDASYASYKEYKKRPFIDNNIHKALDLLHKQQWPLIAWYITQKQSLTLQEYEQYNQLDQSLRTIIEASYQFMNKNGVYTIKKLAENNTINIFFTSIIHVARKMWITYPTTTKSIIACGLLTAFLLFYKRQA
jgi:hypothetical protein